MSYCVLRTDRLAGTYNPAKVISMRFYDSDGNEAQVENGVIALPGDLEEDEREIFAAAAADSTADIYSCALCAGVEIMYDEHLHNPEDFINEAGLPLRGYLLCRGDIFSVTGEGFDSDTLPEKGSSAGIGENGKLTAGGEGFYCAAVESDGRYTWYVMRVE